MAQVPCEYVEGGDVIDHTPVADTPAGSVIVEGNQVGITKIPITAGRLGAYHLRGVYTVPKDSSDITAKGTNAYWDDDGDPVGGDAGSGAFTTTATGNKYAGKFQSIAGPTEETVLLKLASMDDTATLDADHLSDVGTVTHNVGSLLVGDGSKFENVDLTGPFNLSAAGLLTFNTATVAAAGSAQGDAAAIAAGITWVTGADATKGVKFSAAAEGLICIVKNDDTADAVLKVYPNTDDTINALSANAALSMAAKTACVFACLDGTAWFTVPYLPS